MTLSATGRVLCSLFAALALCPQALAQEPSPTDLACRSLAENPSYMRFARSQRLNYQMFFIRCARRDATASSLSEGAACPRSLPAAESSCTSDPTADQIREGRTSCPGAVRFSCEQLAQCLNLSRLTDAQARHCPMFQERTAAFSCEILGYEGWCRRHEPMTHGVIREFLEFGRRLGAPKRGDGKADSESRAPRPGVPGTGLDGTLAPEEAGGAGDTRGVRYER